MEHTFLLKESLWRDDKFYSARGALLDGSKILSAWSIELGLA